MSFYLWAAAAAAAFAALTAWLLLPLARWIPERINQHWQAEAQLHVLHELGELERPRLPGRTAKLPRPHRPAMVTS